MFLIPCSNKTRITSKCKYMSASEDQTRLKTISNTYNQNFITNLLELMLTFANWVVYFLYFSELMKLLKLPEVSCPCFPMLNPTRTHDTTKKQPS